MMKQYAVYIEQINQQRIEVITKNPSEVRWLALRIWRSDPPCVIDVVELPEDNNGS